MLKIGDKCYYVESTTDSEEECYICKIISPEFYQVKMRHSNNYGFFTENKLTKIDPPNWESLEENLEKYNQCLSSE